MDAWEKRLWSQGLPVIAGTDEAGRGPLAGPVVAAAFAVLPAAREDVEVLELLNSVSDSKQMSAQQREGAFGQLTDVRFEGRTVWAIAESSVAEIDEANILRAALTAMARSVQSLNVRPDCVLVDGCNRPPELLAPGERWTRGPSKKRMHEEDQATQPKLLKWFAAKPKPKPKEEPGAESKVAERGEDEKDGQSGATWRPVQVEAVIEGDGRVPCISAASVLAKVHRDKLMEKLHEQYPAYGFQSHKGYGTEAHVEAIRVHGVCPEHRRSFGPVKEALGLGKEEKKPACNLTLMFGGLTKVDSKASVRSDDASTQIGGATSADVNSTPNPRGASKVEQATTKKMGKKRARDSASQDTPKGKGANVREAKEEASSEFAQGRAVKRRLTTKTADAN